MNTKTILSILIVLFATLRAWTHEDLLRQPPRAYEKYAGFNVEESTCKNVLQPTYQYLLHLRNQGHKLALVMTSGSPIKMSKWRIRDDFQGRAYSDINQYIDALENYVRQTDRRDYRQVVKDCVRGRRGAEIDGQACVYASDVRYFHMGFVILDQRFGPHPFVVHFYGDSEYDFLKADIYVETLESYLREDRLTSCDATVMTVGRRMENRLFQFLKGDHAQNLLAQGNRSYNLVAHPWRLESQNCNIWVSEVMASAYFVAQDSWNRTDRRFAKDVLAKTFFRPVKVPTTFVQALGRLAAPFVGGINGEEGNFDHFYGVADIVPARSIIEWLNRHDQVKEIKKIYGDD